MTRRTGGNAGRVGLVLGISSAFGGSSMTNILGEEWWSSGRMEIWSSGDWACVGDFSPAKAGFEMTILLRTCN
ncbi:MAG: hypothetical protein ACYC49_12610 [Ignavibacteriaceae bacterium]